ncbi:uncharacterized protein C19orf44 homolog [Brachionichthys hirsutus]|uniref:uncharacterized protein C19orf44 homolog n=1 Tax=Brachionichthys hirsutus TaxID=412623 RepID=UPI003604B4A4
MWKRGGRSVALDRAQALLSGSRSSRDPESGQGPGAETQGFAFPNANVTFSDVSDSSLSSSTAGGGQRRGGVGSTKSPPRSVGSRFLKKTPSAADRHPTPISNNQTQQVLQARSVPSTLGSQTAALSRLSRLQSRFCSRMQAGPEPKPTEDLDSDMEVSLAAAAPSPEASVEESSSHRSSKGRRFLKKNTSAVVSNTNAASGRAPQAADIGVKSRSRAGAVVPVVVETKRAMSGVRLESDEEDMRKLLGDSWDSADNHLVLPGNPSSMRTSEKMFGGGSQRADSSPPPRRSPPFRFVGEAQPHFNPSVPPPSRSSRRASSSPPGTRDSLSSVGAHSEALSLDELFPVGPGSDGPAGLTAAVSPEDSDLRVMTLDDLAPDDPGGSEEAPGQQVTWRNRPASQNRQQLPRMEEEEEEEEEEEDRGEDRGEDSGVDYQSDFESESRTEPDNSASLVSEHFQLDEDEDEDEVREEASGVSDVRTDEDLSSHACPSPTSDHSRTFSGSRRVGSGAAEDSESRSRSGRTFSCRARRAFKEAAVQTEAEPAVRARPADRATSGPAVDAASVAPHPAVLHSLGAETVEALSTFHPAVIAVCDLLLQHLAVIRRSIDSSRRLHASLVQSLEPPDYRYSTLEDGEKRIHRLMAKEALQGALQEKRDSRHV